MPATAVEPVTQISVAVRLARRYRHHPDCACGAYRGLNGEGWCTVEQAKWSHRVDELLDGITIWNN